MRITTNQTPADLLLRISCVLSLLTLATFAGCGDSGATDQAAALERFTLTDAPEEPNSIEAAIVSLTGTREAEELANDEKSIYEGEVTFVARIGAGKQEPFAEGTAAFLVSEAPEGTRNADPNHDPENCPFCKRRLKEGGPVAYVRFETEEGKLIQHDAREYLGLQKGHVLVIKGHGKYDEDKDMFTVTAAGFQLLN